MSLIHRLCGGGGGGGAKCQCTAFAHVSYVSKIWVLVISKIMHKTVCKQYVYVCLLEGKVNSMLPCYTLCHRRLNEKEKL